MRQSKKTRLFTLYYIAVLYQISRCCASAVCSDIYDEKIIFSMVQGPEAIEKLLEIENNGAFIVNSPKSVINCYRTNMVTLLPKNNIPFPKSLIIKIPCEDETKLPNFNSSKYWVKRGGVHAIHREDVTLVYSEDERDNVLKAIEEFLLKIELS